MTSKPPSGPSFRVPTSIPARRASSPSLSTRSSSPSAETPSKRARVAEPRPLQRPSPSAVTIRQDDLRTTSTSLPSLQAARATSQLKSLNDTISVLKTNFARLDEAVEKLERHYPEMQEELKEACAHLETVEASLEAFGSDLQAMGDYCTGLEENMASLTDRVAALEDSAQGFHHAMLEDTMSHNGTKKTPAGQKKPERNNALNVSASLLWTMRWFLTSS
jgi:septal ring factor EnvC (AmiA/AmiB activator)